MSWRYYQLYILWLKDKSLFSAISLRYAGQDRYYKTVSYRCNGVLWGDSSREHEIIGIVSIESEAEGARLNIEREESGLQKGTHSLGMDGVD